MHKAIDDYQIPDYQLALRAIWQIRDACNILQHEGTSQSSKDIYKNIISLCEEALDLTKEANACALYIEKKDYRIMVEALKKIEKLKINGRAWSEIKITTNQFIMISKSVLTYIPN